MGLPFLLCRLFCCLRWPARETDWACGQVRGPLLARVRVWEVTRSTWVPLTTWWPLSSACRLRRGSPRPPVAVPSSCPAHCRHCHPALPTGASSRVATHIRPSKAAAPSGFPGTGSVQSPGFTSWLSCVALGEGLLCFLVCETGRSPALPRLSLPSGLSQVELSVWGPWVGPAGEHVCRLGKGFGAVPEPLGQEGPGTGSENGLFFVAVFCSLLAGHSWFPGARTR